VTGKVLDERFENDRLDCAKMTENSKHRNVRMAKMTPSILQSSDHDIRSSTIGLCPTGFDSQ
jgi:hypothetical protein